jgi:hypothetical protein
MLARDVTTVQLTLTLSADGDWDIAGPAPLSIPVVDVRITAYSQPVATPLIPRRRIVNGRYVGVPVANGWAHRLRVDLSIMSLPPGAELYVEHAAGNVAWFAADVVYGTVAAVGAFPARFTAARTVWLGGVTAGASWVTLGARLADHSVLSNGDCMRVIAVAR